MTTQEWAIVVTFCGVSAFLLIYGVFAKWYRSVIGQALILEALSVFVLFGQAVAGLWWGFALPDQAATGLLWFIAAAQVYQAFAAAWTQLPRLWRRYQRS
jgi:hypothetical protein